MVVPWDVLIKMKMDKDKVLLNTITTWEKEYVQHPTIYLRNQIYRLKRQYLGLEVDD